MRLMGGGGGGWLVVVVYTSDMAALVRPGGAV